MNPLHGIGAVLCVLGLLLAVASWAWRGGRLGDEAARKSVHLGMGLICCTFPWLFAQAWPVLVLGAIAVAVLAALRLVTGLRRGLGSALHGVDRQSWGELAFPIAVAGVWYLADGSLVRYLVPVLALTFADAAAALVGQRWGRWRYQAQGGMKSWEGSLALFVVGTVVVVLPLELLTTTGRWESLLIGVTIGWLIMLAEAVAWRGLDNLFLPVLVAVLLERFLPLGVTALTCRLLTMLALTAVAWLLRKRSTLHDAAGFGGVLATYAAFGLNDWRWLFAPLVVYLLYPRLSPPTAANSERVHELDAVAAVALPGLVWAFLAWRVPAAELLLAYHASWAAQLAIIGVARFAYDDPQRSLPGVVAQALAMSLVVLLPLPLLVWGDPALLRPWCLAGVPIALGLSVALFALWQPGLRDCPLVWSRWLRQSSCALAAGVPVLWC